MQPERKGTRPTRPKGTATSWESAGRAKAAQRQRRPRDQRSVVRGNDGCDHICSEPPSPPAWSEADRKDGRKRRLHDNSLGFQHPRLNKGSTSGVKTREGGGTHPTSHPPQGTARAPATAAPASPRARKALSPGATTVSGFKGLRSYKMCSSATWHEVRSQTTGGNLGNSHVCGHQKTNSQIDKVSTMRNHERNQDVLGDQCRWKYNMPEYTA